MTLLIWQDDMDTGIDIIEVERVAGSEERFGDRFLGRILVPEEIAYWRSHKNPGPHIAARFAAKEAISKAFGTGIGLILAAGGGAMWARKDRESD